MTQQRSVQLSDAEIHLLLEALDSHEYWQLSEAHERNDGYSTIEDGANAEIDAFRALAVRLGEASATPSLASRQSS